ncbi:fatty acid desaturase [Pseudomonas sp. FW306-02-F02-AA]|uniref:Fatty acid desaturase n=1 Tax=Pseudomonas fluorescens TaxID=294 RepID=A0A0N9VU30_PSEFL|nr:MULTISPECIES: fatty acid desaturase [Pseudomonas]ALI01685.1 fatty acid desaturase [Pseudomonas fluorescens]PMZ01737.1 fatty acid desaturase [Pseudomonas sp. FW306-02-F02-AB]PMZ07632.1 fatty acid desaturase [Pseudomonas sp. FW306-02-H06C]PMZ13350.1 fatty acid desaturase [Pseudomonas sp. FW306-02-F02-AA]PMZ19394.1 fatty acid desaturase [Pseudomonas sp. FW306-02-F08-AA]
MYGTSASPQRLNAQQRSAHIREVVLARGVELRKRYPILDHQDALGVGILAFALAGMIGSAALYLTGHMAWWACLLLNAFFASLTHELEHDLIHSMYFRKQRLPHNLMMGLVWLARPSTINPWIRRHLHLNHHKVSGSEADMEERAITNGEPWGIARLLMVGDNVMSAFIRMLRAKTWAHKFSIIKRSLKVYAPLALVHWSAWYLFLGFHAANGIASLLGSSVEWSATTLSVMQVIDIAAVVIIGPNVLRTFCLHFVSSNMHYYGDIEPGNVIQQTQVLNPWWMWPLQAFCFNFGSSHGIHHFVVKEPFYIRQLTVPVAHKVMREMGVRFNDFGTFGRANRFVRKAQQTTETVREAQA